MPGKRLLSSRVISTCLLASSRDVWASCAVICQMSLQSSQEPPSESILRCIKAVNSILSGFLLIIFGQPKVIMRRINSIPTVGVLVSQAPLFFSVSDRDDHHLLFIRRALPTLQRTDNIPITFTRAGETSIVNVYHPTPPVGVNTAFPAGPPDFR